MKIKSYKLNWLREIDENDNSFWEAPGVYTDEYGSPFYWRIVQKLEGDKIWYHCDSDYELIGEQKGESWPSIEEAKKQMQKWNNQIVKSVNESSKSEQYFLEV